MFKKWHLRPEFPVSFVKKLPGFNHIILQLLYNRGLSRRKEVDEFLNPDYTHGLHDPFLFNEMETAVERIKQAIEKQEKVLIYGDYDADGVTSSVVLEKSLQKLGLKNLDIFIPHREIDGYGLNSNKVQEIIKQKFNLVVTVDCGITNIESIQILKQAGIDTLVVDHHLEGEKLPAAKAILNCSLKREKYPFKKLAGVGVVFKFAQALFRSQPNPAEFEAFEKWLLDLVAIGTIGDVSPILGENRVLVKYGLMVLNKTPRQGLRELIRTCSLSNGYNPNEEVPLGQDLYDLKVRNVSFQLVPRINAAGRVDHASLAYELLTTDDEMEAIALARDIHERNLERQKITDRMAEEAKQMFGEVSDEQKILIAANQGWLPGVVGLVAGKLKDEFFRPVILFAQDGDKFVGSGRSIPQFNITQALHRCDEFLERFGGHSQACGLSIRGNENYQKFVDKIKKVANEELGDVKLEPTLEVEVEVKLADLNWQLQVELEKFEPFAESNPRPLFMVKGAKIEDISEVGKNGGHLRFFLSQGGASRKAISFGTALDWKDKIKIGDVVDVVVEFEVNEWRGNKELQLKVVDWRKSEMDNG